MKRHVGLIILINAEGDFCYWPSGIGDLSGLAAQGRSELLLAIFIFLGKKDTMANSRLAMYFADCIGKTQQLLLERQVAAKQVAIAFSDTFFVSFFIKSIQLSRPVRHPFLLTCILEYTHFQDARLEVAATYSIGAQDFFVE